MSKADAMREVVEAARAFNCKQSTDCRDCNAYRYCTEQEPENARLHTALREYDRLRTEEKDDDTR